jgi:hypothetical protein
MPVWLRTCGGSALDRFGRNLSGEGFLTRISEQDHRDSISDLGALLLKTIELATALERSRAIPLEQIASIALDKKRQLAFVQLSTGTEVQLEATGFADLIHKITELYSGIYAA